MRYLHLTLNTKVKRIAINFFPAFKGNLRLRDSSTLPIACLFSSNVDRLFLFNTLSHLEQTETLTFATKMEFYSFLQSLLICFRGCLRGFKFKLKFKGRGYRAIVLNPYLCLKVGLNTFLQIQLPSKYLMKFRRKKALTLVTPSFPIAAFLAQFLQKLRYPDTYTSKGLHILGKPIPVRIGKIR